MTSNSDTTTRPATNTTEEEKVSFGFENVSPDEKFSRVRGVFESVASRYDLMNDLMSAGVHRIWKSNMIARLNPQPGETLVDVAGGTGDIARAFVKRADAVAKRRKVDKQSFAIIADMNREMLKAGRRDNEPNLVHVCCDAAYMPLPDKCADALTISFGIRNVVEIDKALKEFRRILKPGGRFACLEFSHIPSAEIQRIYDAYSFNVIPAMGELVTGDKDSYQYLVESIRRFPKQQDFAERIKDAGFSRVSYTNYTGGVAALHTGWAI